MLFSLSEDKLSNTLNECKEISLLSIDMLVKRIDKAAKTTSQNIGASCATVVNLQKYMQIILADIVVSIKA